MPGGGGATASPRTCGRTGGTSSTRTWSGCARSARAHHRTFNLEMAATDEMVGIATRVQAGRVHARPRAPARADDRGRARRRRGRAGALATGAARWRRAGIKVSLFIAADAAQIERVARHRRRADRASHRRVRARQGRGARASGGRGQAGACAGARGGGRPRADAGERPRARRDPGDRRAEHRPRARRRRCVRRGCRPPSGRIAAAIARVADTTARSACARAPPL